MMHSIEVIKVTNVFVHLYRQVEKQPFSPLLFIWLHSAPMSGHKFKITPLVRLHKHLDFAIDLADAIYSFSMVTLCNALFIIHVLKSLKEVKSQ